MCSWSVRSAKQYGSPTSHQIHHHGVVERKIPGTLDSGDFVKYQQEEQYVEYPPNCRTMVRFTCSSRWMMAARCIHGSARAKRYSKMDYCRSLRHHKGDSMAGKIDSPRPTGSGMVDGPGKTPYQPAPLNSLTVYGQPTRNPGFLQNPPATQGMPTIPLPGQVGFPPV